MNNLIASFQVNHELIVPGIYVSRVDELGCEKVTTYDVRMKLPNKEPAIHPNAMHTIEHVIATFLRNNDEWKDQVVYWGPMGCLTGFYLILKGNIPAEKLLPLMISAYEYMASYEGEVPGTTSINCGNYLLHDLPMAKYEAKKYVELLKNNPCFEYPNEKRITTEKGMTFFDS